MRARLFARNLLTGCLLALCPSHASPQNPPPQNHYERGVQLIEKNCGDCQGATRAGLEAAIAELRKARDAGDADAARLRSIHRLMARAYATLAHVFLPPDSEEKKDALRRQREALEQALRYGLPDAETHFEYANALSDPKEQMAALLEALAVNPRHAGSRFSLGMLFAAGGEPEEAIYHLRKAVEHGAGADRRVYQHYLQAQVDKAKPASTSQGSAPARCQSVKFGGAVKRGETFERPFARNLVFRLEPGGKSADSIGWTIEALHRLYPRSRADLLWPATPPYRFWNPRYLDVSYGHTARQSVQITPREFHFFGSYASLEIALDALDKVLWPGNHPEERVEEARRALAALPKFDGRLHIRDSRLSGTEQGPGAIEWLKFEVELCAPEDTAALAAPAPQARPQTIRDLDAAKLLEQALLKDQPDIREACADGAKLVDVVQSHYGDLDGDGREDAVLAGLSCMSGTAGIDVFAVYRLDANGKPARLTVTEHRGLFGGRDPFAGLRGKMNFAIEAGRLVQFFPNYREGDPNCCGSAGTRKFIYRWTGLDFVLQDVVDLPPEP